MKIIYLEQQRVLEITTTDIFHFSAPNLQLYASNDANSIEADAETRPGRLASTKNQRTPVEYAPKGDELNS